MFKCSIKVCGHQCDVHNNANSPFSDLYEINDNNLYARVVCPSCGSNLYHCRQCMYNNSRKDVIKRHIESKHISTNDTNNNTTASSEDNDIDFGNNNDNDIDVDMDIMDEGGDDHMNMDIDNNDDNVLDVLPPFELENESSDTIPVDQAEVEQDEFLRNLVATQDDDDDNDTSTSTPTFDYSRQFNPHGLLPIESFDLFGDNVKSKIYYWQNDVHRRLSKGKILLGGIMSIAWSSINRLFCYSIEDVIPLEDSTLMFNMLDHALANRGEQRQNFFDIISNVVQRIPKTISSFIGSLSREQQEKFENFSQTLSSDQLDMYTNLCNISNRNINISVPTTKKEADALLLKGRFSMFARLPSPKVNTESEGHAYVSVSDVVDHALAEGLKINWLQDSEGNVNSDTINGSPYSKELLAKMRSEVDDPDNTALGTIILWSDGFCRTYVKQKDNSVWIMTMTFLNPDGKSKSPMHTYCIVIGKSSSNHTSVFENIMKELDDLRKERTRYCGITGKFIKTSFRVVVYSTDRIERCSLLNTSQIGTFGMRSHWACDVDPKTMPMCTVCFEKLMATLQQSSYPDLNVFNELGNDCPDCYRWCFEDATVPLLDKYPRRSSDSVDCPDPPVHRTVEETHHIPVMQKFSWLRQGLLFAYHNLTVNEWRMRWRNYHLKDYLRSMGMSGDAIAGVWKSAQHKNKYPASVPIPFMPYLWTIEHLLPMDAFINSPMHLLFEGVVDDVMELVHKHMKKQNLLSKFEKFVNEYILEIESLRLGWCRLRKLPKAHWLAEDILGYSRIMPFIYGLFFKNNFNLEAIDNEEHKCIQQLLNSLHVMISTLMNPSTATDVDKIESYIRVYLTCAHQASEYINGKGDDFWMGKGNHLSLLNLPAQIARHGPVRWYYEAVQEAYIQEVKPHLVLNMRKTPTYFRDKLTLIYKLKSMEFVKQRMKSDDDVAESSKGKDFYCYSDLAAIQARLEKGLPLSAIVFKDDFVPASKKVVWIAFERSKGCVKLVPLQYSSVLDAELCGLECAKCTLLTDNVWQNTLSFIRGKISSHCLLLPYIENKVCGSKFAMIHDDWDVLTLSGKGEASLCISLFDTQPVEDVL